MPHVAQILGILGVVGMNVAYILNSSGKMRSDNYLYPFVNFIGASLVMIALLPEWNLAAFLMELSWAMISLGNVVLVFVRRTRRYQP